MRWFGAVTNRLLISAAGSGKTSFVVDRALEIQDQPVLLVTYTEANEDVIKRRLIQENGCVPNNIFVQTWFSFLLQHGVRPFQSAVEGSLHERKIGFYLNSGKSGKKIDSRGKPILVKGRPIYWGERDTLRFYFTADLKIYADKISKFVCAANEASNNSVIERLEQVFKHIFIDEVQDLAGYDLEVLRLLLRSRASIVMVGDPRQVTYLTHNPSKHKKYASGGIAKFIREATQKAMDCDIDETTLSESHRNNALICAYSNRLYPNFPACHSCKCESCNVETSHDGVFAVQPHHLSSYLDRFHPLQLRWNSRVKVDARHAVQNMGESKGRTTDRVLIFPTKDMKAWLWDNEAKLANAARAKLYVALTRARASSAFVVRCPDGVPPDGMRLFSPDVR